MALDFKGRVAIVTGAGGGLGRQHALALAARGARVLVNDLGGSVNGEVVAGGQAGPAQLVVDEIRVRGGEAIASTASVTDFAAVEAMVQQAVIAWGRVDILVNNAGILRDKSFAKMELADFRLVLDVHLMGAVHCSKAVWPLMVERKYGRIVMTTSSSGLYGNFGQANYGAAKMALVGLMQTLAIEGEKYGIKVNCLAPTAMTRMTQDLFPSDLFRSRSRSAGNAGAGQRPGADPHRAVCRRRRFRSGARHSDPGRAHRQRSRRPGAASAATCASDGPRRRNGAGQRRRAGHE